MNIKKIGGVMPHPNGLVQVQYNIANSGQLNAVIVLPKNLTGTFIWKGQNIDLHPGENKIKT